MKYIQCRHITVVLLVPVVKFQILLRRRAEAKDSMHDGDVGVVRVAMAE